MAQNISLLQAAYRFASKLFAEYALDSNGNPVGFTGPNGNAGWIDAGFYGASPSASAAVNTAAIQAALNQGGLVTLNIPGTYSVNNTFSLNDNTHLMLGAGVILQNATGATGTLFKNSNWNSLISPVTAITPTYNGLGTGTSNVIIATTLTGVSAGNYISLKGDPSGIYTGIFKVVSAVSGVSVTIALQSTGTPDLPTLTAGSYSLGIAGYIINPNIAANLAGLTRNASFQQNNGFVAAITTTDGGSGAYVQIDSLSGVPHQFVVSELGYGYTNLTGATVDLTAATEGYGFSPYSGTTTVGSYPAAAIPLTQLATPCFMTISLANANITVEGGGYDMNQALTASYSGLNVVPMLFNKVVNLRLTKLQILWSYYQILMSGIQNLIMDDIETFQGNSCGITGPIDGALIRNVRSRTSDDAMSINVCTGVSPSSTTDDYSSLDLPDCNGAIQDVIWENNNSKSAAASRLLISPGRGFVCRGLKLVNSQGTPNKPHFGLDLITWEANTKSVSATAGGYTTGVIYTVGNPIASGITTGMRINTTSAAVTGTFSTVTSVAPASGQPKSDGYNFAISISGTTGTQGGVINMLFEGIPDVSRNQASVIIGGLAGGGVGLVDDLTVDGFEGDNATNSPAVKISPGATSACTPVIINALKVSGIKNNMYRSVGGYVYIGQGQRVRNLLIDDCIFPFTTSAITGGDNNRWGLNIAGIVDNAVISNSIVPCVGDAASFAVGLVLVQGYGLGSSVPNAQVGGVTFNNVKVLMDNTVGVGAANFISHQAAVSGTANTWSSSLLYMYGQIVLYSGYYYKCTKQCTNVTPTTNSIYWYQLSATAPAVTQYAFNNCTLAYGSALISASESCTVQASNINISGGISQAPLNFYGTSQTHNVAATNIVNPYTADTFKYGTTNTINLLASDGSVKIKSDTAGLVFVPSKGAVYWDNQTAVPGLYARGATVSTLIAA